MQFPPKLLQQKQACNNNKNDNCRSSNNCNNRPLPTPNWQTHRRNVRPVEMFYEVLSEFMSNQIQSKDFMGRCKTLKVTCHGQMRCPPISSRHSWWLNKIRSSSTPDVCSWSKMNILDRCFRHNPCLTNPRTSPLTIRYDCSPWVLGIIAALLETNKRELRTSLVISC